MGLCINGSSHSEQGEQGANHSYLTKRENRMGDRLALGSSGKRVYGGKSLKCRASYLNQVPAQRLISSVNQLALFRFFVHGKYKHLTSSLYTPYWTNPINPLFSRDDMAICSLRFLSKGTFSYLFYSVAKPTPLLGLVQS